MLLVPIEVECYSGYRGNEAPRIIHGSEGPIEVEEILDRWYQGDRDARSSPADYFKVRGADQNTYLLKYDRAEDRWYLRVVASLSSRPFSA